MDKWSFWLQTPRRMEGIVLSHLRSPKVLWLCYLSFQGDVWSSQCILTRPWVSSSTTRMEFALLDTTENHHCSYLAHKATTKAFQCFILNFNFGHFIFKVVSSSLSIFNPPTPYGWEYLGVWYLPSFLSTLFFNASCWCSSIPELLCAESKHFGFQILF